ncbi:hypothetical protein CEXT_282711 [Caerostris extrusa]|uniref:Uncharacterized protein n=1 Tax=Caerostris extrusa TaxID=172846 RepID=A0AAV4WE75_CAEEX|nr:hypothetical protein CEXT_282711 [Caerostris extrusa]
MPSNSSGMNRCWIAGVVPEKSRQGSGASSRSRSICQILTDSSIYGLLPTFAANVPKPYSIPGRTATQLIRSLDSGCTQGSKLPPRTGENTDEVWSTLLTAGDKRDRGRIPQPQAAPTAHPVLTPTTRTSSSVLIGKTVCTEGSLLSTFALAEGIWIRNLSCLWESF